MRRRSRLALIIGGCTAGLAIVLIIAALLVAQSGWFREQVRGRIVSEVEKSTGGRVEIDSFTFDWHTLTARVLNFVIHGTEPAGSQPLFRARSLTVVLKIISVFKRKVDIQSVDVDQPQAYLIIYPNGSTNIPEPRVPRQSNKTAVETILDLAVGRFTVQNGFMNVNALKVPWNAAGENLRAQFTYNLIRRSYSGDISIQPIHLKVHTDLPVDMGIKVSLALEKNKLTISSAKFETLQSNAVLSGTVQNFPAPQSSFQFHVRLSLDETGRVLRLTSRPQGTVLVGGNASFSDLQHYLFTGNLHTGSLSFRQGDLHFTGIRAESAFRADPEKITLDGIRLSAFEGNFNGRAQIVRLDRFRLEGEAGRFDLRRAAHLYSQQRMPWDGLLSGPVEVQGRLSELHRGGFEAKVKLGITPAPASPPVHGLVEARYDGSRKILDLGHSYFALPSTRLDFTGTLGQTLRVQLRSTNLDELVPAVELFSSVPVPIKLENGTGTFNGTVTGRLIAPQIAGHVALTNFVYAQEKFDSFNADISAQKSGVAVRNAALARGNLQAQFAATVALRDWRPDHGGPLSATGSVRGADVADVLALAGRKNIPAKGSLAASGQISGTVGNPLIKSDLTVTNGSFYEEPFDRLAANVSYVGNLVTVANGQIKAGPRQLTFTATYTHAPENFENGRLTFQTASNRMAMEQFHFIERYEPSLTGTVELTANGVAAVSTSRAGTSFQLVSLDADVAGHGIQVQQMSLGDLHLAAKTEGSVLTAHFESDFAQSAIKGDGRWRLEDSYPGSANVIFSKLDFSAVRAIVTPSSTSPLNFTGSAEGKLEISGPLIKPEAWTATLDIPRLEISQLPGQATAGNNVQLALHNSGPVRIVMQNSIIRVESARLVGQSTNIALTGTISTKDPNPLNLQANGTVDLGILQDFDRDLMSSGDVALDATIRGPLKQPLITGEFRLKDANLNVASFPNGIANANGVILFNGDRATIQSLTGESGGGKISASGFVSYVGGEVALRIDVSANQVRVRYPEGASTVADASLNWTGTTQRSLVAGTVTVLRTGFNPHTDFGSILAKSAEPVRTAATRTGLLGGMHFDVQIQTSPDVVFESALTQQLQLDANLRMRGTPANPVLLGRINITEGELTFFGNKYTINQGSIAFFNPVKLEPIFNIDLQTRARGVDVTVTISGPINQLNMSYRSDPPMQFSELVALLATGRAPSSDPSATARASGAAQTWQQMGASALIGQAIANPVAGRLQRFFGVSKIKIDPLLTGLDNPQARLTLEQQISPDITFTYITNLNRSYAQVIRIEWDVGKRWSVVALREENGLFGLDVYYKKRFK